jgi:hypothetical protein
MTFNIPSSAEEIYTWQFFGVIIMVVISLFLQWKRKQDFDFHSFAGNIMSGASLPVFFLLSLVPFKPAIVQLFSTVPLYLMLTGFLGMAMTIYSIVKKPSKNKRIKLTLNKRKMQSMRTVPSKFKQDLHHE